MVDYTLSAAGPPDSDWEFDRGFAQAEWARQLKGVRYLIGASKGCFLRDAVRDLPDYAADGRLLIVERVEGGRKTVEGCVGYIQPLLQGIDPKTGMTIMRRVTMLRLLVVRASDHSGELALRLCLETQLRAAVRSMRDDDDRPHSIGIFGAVYRSNHAALGWAQKFKRGSRARIIVPTARNVKRDPTLALVHEFTESIRTSMGSEQPYLFVVGNRRNLIEAAALHREGRLPPSAEATGLQIFYDSSGADPHQNFVDLAADNLSWGNPVTLDRMGVSGRPSATVWGPPETDQMRLGDDRTWRKAT